MTSFLRNYKAMNLAAIIGAYAAFGAFVNVAINGAQEQVSIQQDLKSKVINEEDAKFRREALEKEQSDRFSLAGFGLLGFIIIEEGTRKKIPYQLEQEEQEAKNRNYDDPFSF